MNDAELRHHVMDRVCQCHDDLLRLVKENSQLREIVEALATVPVRQITWRQDGVDLEEPFCTLCEELLDDAPHSPDCPYRRAREWMESHNAS